MAEIAYRFDREASKSVIRRRGIAWWTWLVPLLLIGLFFMLLVPTMCRPREGANRIKCASNLRQIGMALQVYADANGGRLPATFGELAVSSDITSDVFCCPTSNVVDRPPGKTAAEWGPKIDQPDGHFCAYVYAGANLNWYELKADDVLAFEKTDNHGADGMNVLYRDGHVDWLVVGRTPDSRAPFDRFLADFVAGKRPLKDWSTPAATQP